MTKLFNGRETYITGYDISMLFEWNSLWLKPRLFQGVVWRLSWLFPVPRCWHLQRPFLERGMKNKIWVCGDILCLIFYLSIAIIRWEPNFWRDYCSPVSIYAPGIKIDYELLVSKSSWLGSKIWPLWKRPLIQGSFLLPIKRKKNHQYMHLFLLHVLVCFNFSEKYFWPQYMYPNLSPNNGYCWCPLVKLSHLGLEQLIYKCNRTPHHWNHQGKRNQDKWSYGCSLSKDDSKYI